MPLSRPPAPSSRVPVREVLAVYAVKNTSDPANGQEVVTMDDEKIELLKQVFLDMNELSSFTSTTPGEGSGADTTTLYITVITKMVDEMADLYGFSYRVDWCAIFVSWCADQCGYIDAGVMPKFAGCVQGSQWFKDRGCWQDRSYEPQPGDIIFYGWDDPGGFSGQQGEVPDHVGIVERVENGRVYTVEGNSGDRCVQRNCPVGYYEIFGYGISSQVK